MTVRLARLKNRADFLRVAGARISAGRPGLVLQAAPQPPGRSISGEEARVGFTASRRVGNAVARNRAKRRLRAAAVAVLALQAKTGNDYVLIARPDTGSRRYADLVGDLEGALRQVGRPRRDRGKAPR